MTSFLVCVFVVITLYYKKWPSYFFILLNSPGKVTLSRAMSVNLRIILSYGKKITVRKYLKNQSNYDSSSLLPYFDLRCAMNSVQIVSSILQAANNKLVSKEFQEKISDWKFLLSFS